MSASDPGVSFGDEGSPKTRLDAAGYGMLKKAFEKRHEWP
jgi:hypothetical protein